MPTAQWPLRVNISEEDVWAPYDSARGEKNTVLDWASDNAWDDWKQMGKECLDLLQDLVDAFVPKAQARKISEYDIRRICEAIKDDSDPFETIRQIFLDASTWAWEEAYTPQDGDIEKALEVAVDEALGEFQMGTYWDLVLSGKAKGPKDWSPLKRFTEKDLLREIEAGISFEHEQGQWDRFVVFDVMDGPVMKDVRRRLQSTLIDENGHMVRVPFADFERDIKDQFVDPIISKLERTLGRVMERVEPWQRADFHKHWKQVLKDKSYAKSVTEEILDWLKKNPADGADDGDES